MYWVVIAHKKDIARYLIVASFNTFCLEAHPGIFRLLMKGIFDAYVLWPFDKKLFLELVMRVNTRDFTVSEITK